MNKIQKIYWKNAILFIESNCGFDISLQSKDKCFLFDRKDTVYSINLTNVEETKMLPANNWDFICLDENQSKMTLDENLLNQFIDLDKMFSYGLNYYLYTARFAFIEEDEGIRPILKTEFYERNKNPYKRNYACESNSFIQYVLKKLNHISEIGISALFSFFKMIRTCHKDKVLLMSEARAPISDNLKAIDDKIKQDYSNQLNVEYYFKKTLELNKIELFFNWVKLCWKIAGCYYVILDDYSPIFKFIKTKNRNEIIQVWHAGVGFKAVGYARFGKEGSPYPYQSAHREYSHVIVGSKGLVSIYEEVFGVSKDIIHPYGLPRLDHYLDSNRMNQFKNVFYQDYPLLKNKKIILFAPTYRGTTQDKAYYPYDKINYDTIRHLYKLGYVFCIKMHPFVKEKIDIPEDMKLMIIDLSKCNNINNLFYVTDILITDYSSNVYEYSLMRRPVIYYAFDYDSYKLTRGLQSDLNDIEFGTRVNTFEEIVDVIQNEKFNLERIDEYIDKNHSNFEHEASVQIIENILLKGRV